MDHIMAMVKTVPQPRTSLEETNSIEPRVEVKSEIQESMLAQVFPHLSTSSESTSEDHSMSFEYADSDSLADGKPQQLSYRHFVVGDPREKKLQEKIEFVKIVLKHKSSLFGDCDGHEITPRSKEDAWKRVAGEVESANLESYRGKPWARLRDHDWQYVRRHALSRNENSTRPGGKLGELDKIVLEIISTTALANAFSATSSLISQGSTNSHTSQQSTDSVDLWRSIIFNSVNQESTDTPEIGTSFDSKEDSSTNPKEDIAVNTSLSIPVPVTPVTSTAENILEYIKATHVSPSFPGSSVDTALHQARALTKSPTSKKYTMRSATAPSVYAITSSTASPPQLTTTIPIQPPSAKRSRVESEKSPGASSVTSSSFEQKKEALTLRKLEVDIRHTELLNEKLELEIRAIEAQEKRNQELHAIELRAAKARMLRGAAIDEPSIDTNQRVLVRQPNGYNLE
uniref:Regulatory protein zeste n=1 Tax=Caenorhabditis tropicalis TaxID=1561998 RepID=A0A1I7THT3_9PELO